MTLKPLPEIAIVALVSLLLFTGCGRYYWHRPGGVEADFQQESRQCVGEAVIAYNVVSEDVYRACMNAYRWTRVQGWQSCPEGAPANAAQCPGRNEVRFRGPEDQEDFARILAEPRATPR